MNRIETICLQLTAKAWLYMLIVACGGCYVPNRGDEPVPPSGDAIADAAEAAVYEYAAGLARSATETADHAGDFKSYAEAFDSEQPRNKAARESAFKPYIDAMDATLKPQDDKYDADLRRKAGQSAATGFGKVRKR